MHAAPTALQVRSVYVPAPRRTADASKQRAEALGPELATRSAGAAFRGVPWRLEREAEFVEVQTSLAQPAINAGQAFARIPWSGAAASEPTAAQYERSVRTVLEKFNWE